MSKYLAPELKRSKYRLLGLVGQGQFGRVFCATHRKTGRLVALKDLDRQRFPTHSFLRELRFLLSLQHENIVTCQALEHTGTGRYLVMDYCEGGTLRHLMEGEGTLNLAQSLQLILDILSGLGHAHSRNIVHCDIKPENILLSVQAEGWLARISDFGIARLVQEVREAGNTGSPAYMAPERFYGQYSHSSDIYAVGVLLYELLVGHRPFSGTPPELMAAHLNQPLQIPDYIPEALKPVLMGSLQKLPARRYHSVPQMLMALQAAIAKAGLDTQTVPVPLQQPQISLSESAFRSAHTQPLNFPIQDLAVAALPGEPGLYRLYTAMSTPEGCQIAITPVQREQTGLTLGSSRPVATLPEPMTTFAIAPQSCFAIADSGLYCLTLEDSGSTPTLMNPRLVELPRPCLSAIAPDGQWLTTVTPQSATSASTVQIWPLPASGKAINNLPLAPTATVTCQSPQPSQVLILDAGHIAVISDLSQLPGSTVVPKSIAIGGSSSFLHQCQSCCHTGMLLEVFTRRGHALAAWNFPISMRQVLKSHKTHRLLVTEQGSLTSGLLIDLKPLRISRINLGVQPQLLVATPWGYVVVDLQGQMVLLNEDGQQVGRVQVPATPTALAVLGQHHLLLSTWNPEQEQGNLYTIDLKQLDIDLLF